MWTNEELVEIRSRAELEADNPKQNILWRNACVDLAKSCNNLLMLTDRICAGEITALADKHGRVKLPQAIEG